MLQIRRAVQSCPFFLKLRYFVAALIETANMRYWELLGVVLSVINMVLVIRLYSRWEGAAICFVYTAVLGCTSKSTSPIIYC